MSFSKNKLKLYASLKQKKYRDKENLFVVEGKKMVFEALTTMPENLQHILHTKSSAPDLPKRYLSLSDQISVDDLKKISSLRTPQPIIAVLTKKNPDALTPETINDLVVVLDSISDPGNLGTIIRLCDWFGINNLICSEQTVDQYNPKVIQATMGSIFRVQIEYKDIKDFISQSTLMGIPAYGTTLDGKNIYTQNTKSPCLIIMGNESTGISPEISNLLTDKLLIPDFAKQSNTGESLNVSTATAIALSEFRRKENYSK